MSEKQAGYNDVPNLYPERVESNSKGILIALLSIVVAIVALVLIFTFFSYSSPKRVNFGKSEDAAVTETAEAVEPATVDETTDGQTADVTPGTEETTADESIGDVSQDAAVEDPASAEEQPEEVVTEENTDYIFPDSSSRVLTREDLEGKSAWELRVARNEIYARYGRMFDDQELQDYFNSKSWYSGTISPDSFSENTLTDIERQNTVVITDYEKEMGYR